jgi:hypothetical protein
MDLALSILARIKKPKKQGEEKQGQKSSNNNDHVLSD